MDAGEVSAVELVAALLVDGAELVALVGELVGEADGEALRQTLDLLLEIVVGELGDGERGRLRLLRWRRGVAAAGEKA